MRWKCACCGYWCKSTERRYKEGDLQRVRFLVARQEWFLFRCLRASQFLVRVLVPVQADLERDEKFFPFDDDHKKIWAELDKSRPGGSSSYETTMSEFSERISHDVGESVLKRYFDAAWLNQRARIQR